MLITWNAVPGTRYEIQRTWYMSFSWETLSTTATSPYVEEWNSPGFAYLYRVRAVSSCQTTPFSNADIGTPGTFTDDPLIAGTTTVKAVHLQELQTAIDKVRELAYLSPASYTDGGGVVAGGPIKAIHIAEMRTALNAALTRLGFPTPTYTDPSLTGGTAIRAAHVQELRNLIR
jgi:hypothetical protein